MIKKIIPAMIIVAFVLFTLWPNPGLSKTKDDAQVIESVINNAISRVFEVCHQPGLGFYTTGDNRYQTWDTATTLYILDWLVKNGWNLSEYETQIENARAWLESARHDNGSYTFSPPDNPESCNETTIIAAQVVPFDLTNQWIIDHQFEDGHWEVLIPALPLQDYPSVTAFALHGANCLALDIDWDNAYQWLMEQTFVPSIHYYTSRFYITWLLAAASANLSDFPADLVATMKSELLLNQDPDGSFELRTMLDNPSAIIPTSLAAQTAMLLDDPDLDDLVDDAILFLMLNRADNGFWWGGLYSDSYNKNESLFATIMTQIPHMNRKIS